MHNIKIEFVNKNDYWHRGNGPAVIWSDNIKWYYLNGIRYSKEKYYEKLNKCKKN